MSVKTIIQDFDQKAKLNICIIELLIQWEDP